MICNINEGDFDTSLETTDWRYSATAVGLIRYFKKMEIPYEIIEDKLFYKRDTVIGKTAEEDYLKFAEYYFKDFMHHISLEEVFENDEFSDEQIKFVNTKLIANSVLKKIFEKLKFDGTNKTEIAEILNKNKLEIIRETHRNSKRTYRNFCNTSLLCKDKQKVCRILGYDIDTNRKSKSISYNFDTSTYVARDEEEFDYIPFGFSKTRESIFVNNNFNIKDLVNTNDRLNEIVSINEDTKENHRSRKSLFFSTSKGVSFIESDVEVIRTEMDNDYFETMFVRKLAITIFNKINEDENIQKMLESTCRLKEKDNYIDLMFEATNSIINQIKLDYLIEKLLKDESSHGFQISQLIKINKFIYKGVEEMEDAKMKQAYACAKTIVSKFKAKDSVNKIKSYRQKLISCLVFKDYDRFKEILLQLSAYSGESLGFAYELFEDFDVNKNIAYTFVNALEENQMNKGGNTDEK